MTVRSLPARKVVAMIAIVAASACHRAAPAPIIFARSEVHVYPTPTRAQLDSFTFDVALPTDSGECVRRPMLVGVGRMVAVYYPDQRRAVASATATLDDSGRIVRFQEQRGRALVRGLPGATRQQLDSIFAEAKRTTRNSSMFLDFVTGQAILANDGGGRPDQRMMVPLGAVLNESRFGKPGALALAIVERCAARSASASGATVRPYFGFQLDKPATYVGGDSISPHPIPDGGGANVVQFVVDSTGGVRPSTLKVLRMNDPQLIEELKRVLPQWRYRPAEVDGRKVSQLVQTAIGR